MCSKHAKHLVQNVYVDLLLSLGHCDVGELSFTKLSYFVTAAAFSWILPSEKKDNGTLHFSLTICLCMKRGGEQVLNANSHRPCLEEDYFLLNA